MRLILGNVRHDPRVSATTAERFVVCLPTYNERENLERMIDAIAAARAASTTPELLDVVYGTLLPQPRPARKLFR